MSRLTTEVSATTDGQVRLRIGTPGQYNDHPLPLPAAFALACDLMAFVEGLLAGAPRPWDDDPGRTPFVSRRSPRRAERSGGGRSDGNRRSPRDGYPRPRAVRPGGPVDSAA